MEKIILELTPFEALVIEESLTARPCKSRSLTLTIKGITDKINQQVTNEMIDDAHAEIEVITLIEGK